MAMTKSMQVDYARHGIRVNALLPGTILTPFVEDYLKRSYDDPKVAVEQLKERQLAETLGSPEDVAYAALYLASDEARYVLGSGLVVDGGVTAGKLS
jgi:NAD(P)-dependent dehydrogenase (short-subunit alcohol dehydrogenase family)